MNFLNSYISIFKRKINDKIYVKSMLLILILTYLGSFILNQMDFLISDNDVIRNYQLEKINSSNLLNVNTIIIGDSSGGNAIDSKFKWIKHSKFMFNRKLGTCRKFGNIKKVN